MKALAYFLPLLTRNKGLLIGTLLLSLLTMAAGIGLLGLSGWFITAAAVAGTGALFNIIGPSAGVRGLSFLRIAGRYGERYTGHAMTLGLVARTRAWLFERLFRRIALRPDIARADTVSRLTADLDSLDNIFLVALGPMSTAAITAIAMGVLLWFVLPGAALAYTVLFLLATLAVPLLLLRRTRRRAAEAVAASAELRAELLDGLDGHRDLVLFGQTRRMREGTGRAAGALAGARIALGRLAANASLAVQLLSGAALVVALLVGLDAFAQDAIDGAMLAGVLLAILASFEASQAVVRSVVRLAASIAAAERVIDLAEGPAETEPADPVEPARQGAVDLRQVHFAYPGHSPILRALDLAVSPGERVAIVGPSGSGKSTIAQLLVRLLLPGAGVCHVDGADLARMRPADIRQRVALMTQDAPVFSGSVRENLKLAAPDAGDAELWAALEEVDFAAELRAARGLDTNVGEAGAGLSTGQARRLALARTLLTGADTLVLDEPTAGLSRDAAAAFLQTLAQRVRGRTVIAITHLDALDGFDRVLELRDGRLMASA